MTTPFVHLHCHSHYSHYNGTASPGELLRRAKEFDMPDLALLDFCNLHEVAAVPTISSTARSKAT